MSTLHRSPKVLQSFALIALSLLFLPLNIYVLLSAYVLQLLSPFSHVRRRKVLYPRRVLVSGVNSAIGLALARNLYLQGHHVIGADNEKYRLLGMGRFSRSIRRFYPLPELSEELGVANYIHRLVEIVKDERIDTYISCSSITSAAEDAVSKSVIEKVTGAKCIAFDAETAAKLSSPTTFLQLARSTGLDVPEVHSVTSRDQIHKILGPTKRKEKAYTLSKASPSKARNDATKKPLLPRRSLSQTYQFVSQISVSNNEPYVLEEHVVGEEYCSYVLIVGGYIEGFVACLESQGNHVKGLEIDSLIYHAVYRSTKLLTDSLPSNFSGPLTIYFRVQMLLTTSGYEKKLVPRACVPKIGLPSLLLVPSARIAIPNTTSSTGTPIVAGWQHAMFSNQGPQNIYWIVTDLLNLVLLPIWDVLRWKKTVSHAFRSWREFVSHLFFWKEAVLVMWDPLPWFWQYGVFWPLRLSLSLIYREKWNVLDVTTNELRYDQ